MIHAAAQASTAAGTASSPSVPTNSEPNAAGMPMAAAIATSRRYAPSGCGGGGGAGTGQILSRRPEAWPHPPGVKGAPRDAMTSG